MSGTMQHGTHFKMQFLRILDTTGAVMSGDVDSKLDSLISRIQSLSGGAAGPVMSTKPVSPQPIATTTHPPTTIRTSEQAYDCDSPEPTSSEQDRSESLHREPARPRPTPPQSAIGFKPSRDEPWRPNEPTSIEAAGVNETLLEAIVYRFIRNIGETSGRRISDQVKLPFGMIEPMLTRLKSEQNVAYKNATSTNDYVYTLTESGRAIARGYQQDCTYYGACPVPLQEYIASVKRQTIEGQYPKKKDLLHAFKDLLINPAMLNKLGPAVASGRGMFLFGFPGNGKTSIAERVTGAFGKYVWIPRHRYRRRRAARL